MQASPALAPAVPVTVQRLVAGSQTAADSVSIVYPSGAPSPFVSCWRTRHSLSLAQPSTQAPISKSQVYSAREQALSSATGWQRSRHTVATALLKNKGVQMPQATQTCAASGTEG